jgi:hypothetical protein
MMGMGMMGGMNGIGYTTGNYGMGYGYVPGSIGGTTSPLGTATTNTAAMFGGWGAGYTMGTATMPYYGQNSAFGNTLGNTYGTMLGMPYTSQTGMTGSMMGGIGDTMCAGGSCLESDEVSRHDQGHMMGMGSMGWMTSSPTTITPAGSAINPLVTTSTVVPAGSMMPFANAIDSQGVAGYLNGLGTASPTFTPRGSAAATSPFNPAYGSAGTFTPAFTPYGWTNQAGFTFGSSLL